MPEGTNDPAYSAAVGIALWGIRNLPAENHVGERKISHTSELSGTATSANKETTGALSMIRGWLPKREKETAGT
jgi:hypothetical protein